MPQIAAHDDIAEVEDRIGGRCSTRSLLALAAKTQAYAERLARDRCGNKPAGAMASIGSAHGRSIIIRWLTRQSRRLSVFNQLLCNAALPVVFSHDGYSG